MKIVYFIFFLILLTLVIIYLLYFPMVSGNWDLLWLIRGVPNGSAVVDTTLTTMIPKGLVVAPVGVDSTALAGLKTEKEAALKKAEELAAKLAQAQAELAQKPLPVDTTIQKVVEKKSVIGKPLEFSQPVEDLAWVVYNHSGDSLTVQTPDGKLLAAGDSVVAVPRIPIGTKQLVLEYGKKREEVEVTPNQLPSVVVWVGFYSQGDYFGSITVARVEVIDDNPLDEIRFSLMGGDTLLSSSRLEPGKWVISAGGDKIIIKERVERYRFSFSVADPSHNPRVFSSSFAVIKKGRAGVFGWLIGD